MVPPRAHGVGTAAVARALEQALAAQGYDVLYGHGTAEPTTRKGLGQLHTWYGDRMGRASMLADLDIAIVERASDHALVLVEVEETTDRAKVLIGDVFTALLGSGVSHLGRQLYVGAWTTLAVVARLRRAARADRLPFIEEQVMALKAKLTTPNAVIGRVLVRGYGTDAELEAVLLDIVQSATHR